MISNKFMIDLQSTKTNTIFFSITEYVLRFATAEMANSLSQSITGQSSSKGSSSTNSSNQTNKHETDEEALSDFSEDETANMDLE